ncbi:substrate-binding periplasmic protein [Actinosynnema sp. CA-299493]
MLLREAVWLAPTTAVTVFLAVVLLTEDDVEVLGAVVGTVLAMLGIAIAIVTFRIQSAGQKSPWVLSPRATWVWRGVSVAVTITLVALTMSWPLSDDDPDTYFADDELVVGINGDLPGWGEDVDDVATAKGFDVELAKFLAQQYEIPRIRFVRLTQAQRLNQWSGPAKSDVDIVISAFSITPGRLPFIDMAGPYYVDRSMSFGNGDKGPVLPGDEPRGCAVGTTTGQDRLASVSNMLATRKNASLKTMNYDELKPCYDAFFDPGTDMKFIASDWSIIKAFRSGTTITYADDPNQTPVTDLEEPEKLSDGREEYGVAIREDHPAVCADLADKIQLFLDTRWQSTFVDTVGQHGLSPLWHKPEKVNKGYCASDGVVDQN